MKILDLALALSKIWLNIDFGTGQTAFGQTID
jgi:hypothetical protein